MILGSGAGRRRRFVLLLHPSALSVMLSMGNVTVVCGTSHASDKMLTDEGIGSFAADFPSWLMAFSCLLLDKDMFSNSLSTSNHLEGT